MSHPVEWRCRACKTPLGTDHGGELTVRAAGATLGRDGVLRVPCPACGLVRARPVRSRPGVIAGRPRPRELPAVDDLV
jgi:hypothetical protein